MPNQILQMEFKKPTKTTLIFLTFTLSVSFSHEFKGRHGVVVVAVAVVVVDREEASSSTFFFNPTLCHVTPHLLLPPLPQVKNVIYFFRGKGREENRAFPLRFKVKYSGSSLSVTNFSFANTKSL